jgi:hypothetical protein
MLKVFNQDLVNNTRVLQGQFQSLEETWKDRQFQEFAQEFERLIRMLHQFVQYSEQQIPLLQKKAEQLDEYQVGSVSATSIPVSTPSESDKRSSLDPGIVLEAGVAVVGMLHGAAGVLSPPEPYQMQPNPRSEYSHEIQQPGCDPNNVQVEGSLSEIPPDFEQLNDAHNIAMQRQKEEAEAGDTDEPTISGSTDPPGRWIDRGIQNVCVADLPEPDGISGPDDFKKVSQAVMQAGILRLQEMLPMIEGGEGKNSDYWAQIDQQRGLDYENGYQRIYEAFYGNSAIKLERIGNQYAIINGRHRLWLAKQMGIMSLPVQVVERRDK